MEKEPWLDETALEKLYALGGEELVGKMIRLFLENVPKRIAAATNGEKSGDLRVVEQAAHSIQSSAGNLGASRLLATAVDLERAAGKQQAEQVSALLPRLQQTFEQVKSYLEEKKEKKP